ncbi:DNA-binding domain-containing protein [Colwellia psychrerythraea]|uniref:Putative DNA-binding domain-containing protein n=1 Tax=Colwellia psychrerythraea TaxID=28229 RepID=A0A099KYW1_COLPS|nr:DNA-binding domain-containing protein [Colwellia psychrerythraea]KGJ94833.1 Protein of unknown function DUF2063 [Colwellia psychrerythraea]
MTKLAELQANFFKDCLSGTLTADNTTMSKDIDSHLISAQGLMGIYQHSALANITTSLSLTFPVVEKLVGDDFFAQVCRQYILAHWPISANMDDYGDSLPQFLAELEQVKQLVYLKDVAKLEWLFHQSSLAKDSKYFDWATLAGVAPTDTLKLNFILAPSVALIKSTQPINKIWQMNQDNAPQNIELSIDGETDTFIVLFKRGLKTEMMTITASEFFLLQSLFNGLNFEQTIEAVMASTATMGADTSIDNILKKHMELGVICGFSI